jgi:hypothetical protein
VLLDDARGPRTTLRGLFLETNWVLKAPYGKGSLGDVLFLLLTGGRVPAEELSAAIEVERERAMGAFYRLLQGPLEKPYLRLCAADYALATQRAYAQAAEQDACQDPAEGTTGAKDPGLAPWSFVASDLDFRRRLRVSLAKLQVETELTRLVLQAREGREGTGGRAWPSDLEGLASRACPGRRWTYTIGDDGSASLRLEPNAFGQKGVPERFRMSGR